MNKRNVLVISYYFYPLNDGGTKRVNEFVKFLFKNNIDFEVFTVKEEYYYYNSKNTSYEDWMYKKVKRFRSLLPKNKRFVSNIYSMKRISKVTKLIKKIIKYFIIPDKEIFWLPFLLKILFLKKKKYEAIFASSPPFSNVIIAYILSMIYKSKLYVDVRDDLFGNKNIHICPSRVHEWLLSIIEKIIFKKAEAIFVATEHSINLYKSRYPKFTSKFYYIPNGFLKEDFKNIRFNSNCSNFYKKSNKLSIGYYGSLNNYRTPESLFKAISEINYKDFIINFYGYLIGKSRELFDYYKDSVGLNLVYNGYLEGEKYYNSLLYDDDILLVIQSYLDGGITAIPGKLYEYFYTKKVILIITVEGATKELAKKYSRSVVANYNDIDDIKKALKYVYNNYSVLKNVNIGENEISFIESFERTRLYSKIIKIMGIKNE